MALRDEEELKWIILDGEEILQLLVVCAIRNFDGNKSLITVDV